MSRNKGMDKGTAARVRLVESVGRRLLAAFVDSTEREPVLLVVRPEGDRLAQSAVKELSLDVVDGVAVAALDRTTFVLRLGPALAANIAEAIAAGMPRDGRPWLVCIAWGGATASAATLPPRGVE